MTPESDVFCKSWFRSQLFIFKENLAKNYCIRQYYQTNKIPAVNSIKSLSEENALN